MYKVKLNGTLHLSNDLASRLQARGLLSRSGESTEDFILYLQECLARDDARYIINLEKSISHPLADSEVQSNNTEPTEISEFPLEDTKVVDSTDSKPSEKIKQLSSSLNSLIEASDLSALKEGMRTLYQGG